MNFLHGSILIFDCLCVNALQSFDSWGHERFQLKDTAIHFRYSQSGKPPLLLVHGFPQHSPTWRIIGPLLAEQYTIIAPDNRGNGESSLSSSDNYTAVAGGEDLFTLMNLLEINSTFVLAHDKGVGLAASLAIEHPELVRSLILVDYPLPGYGYTENVTSPNLYMNWQLAFFAVPDAAQFFIQGREKEMLAWYFWHASYSGNSAISEELLNTYTRAISKPGFLRAAMGGEASFAPETALRSAFEPIADQLETYVIPKAGHRVGDENPQAVANHAHRFFAKSPAIASIDISWLDDGRLTLFGAADLDTVTVVGNRTE